MAAVDHKRRRRRPKTPVCVGCGRGIQTRTSSKEPGDQTVDIRIGTVLPLISEGPGRPRKNKGDDFRCEQKWGRMHFPCFLRAMESTDQFLVDLESYGV